MSVIARRSTIKLTTKHQAYLITATNATYFAKHFIRTTKEPSWNPKARFLIIVYDLDGDLELMFNTFLKLHAINVVVVNATDDAHLYSYNPFDNYNCGKRYDEIISYGKCSQAHSYDLYPEKLVTRLQNCTFNVLLTQWPPYTIITANSSNNDDPLMNGAEPYLIRTIGDKLGFNINILSSKNESEEFPTVSSEMTAVGTLKRIQDSEADILIGGMLLTPSRALAFSYVYGLFVYTDEIRFVVKRASDIANWKYIYLEFDHTVWLLLLLALMTYSMLTVILLRTKDRSYVVLNLLSNLVLHGRTFQTRWSVKYVLIIWVVFAYLVNTFYHSSLVSLVTHPVRDYQISTEEDLTKYQLKPCFSSIMGKYYVESVQSDGSFDVMDGCYGLMESVTTVSKSSNMYTIILYGVYQYHEQKFFDEYGNHLIIPLPEPYSKVIYSMYMYKGFPMVDELRHRSLQLRESGIVDKVMRDMIFKKQIKYSYHHREYVPRFAIPWVLYIVGCSASIIAFVIEIISKRNLPT
uniref:Putative ionotropic receptor ligand binding domain-containing protein n=1 Tax=Heliothis virescens TaxID=7102 RepID=A0A2A4IVU0_HELVI